VVDEARGVLTEEALGQLYLAATEASGQCSA
jgi:hypothetical protein